MTELWKSVVGFEGAYEVSDLGRVRSLLRGGRVLRPGRSTSCGHLVVLLGRKNKRYVHALVAEAFVGPRPLGCDVLHLDGNAGNNAAVNLKYGTRSENNAHVVYHGRRKVTIKQIKWARAQLADGRFGSLTRVARTLGVSVSHALRIKRREVYAHV